MTTTRMPPMPPLNLPVSILGRPLKPLAFGMAIAMVVLCLAGLFDTGALDGSLWGDVVALIAAASCTSFMAGWWARNQPMAEAGLLLACWVFTTRAAALLFIGGAGSIAAWLSIASAIIAGGAYVLERTDPRVRGPVTRVDPS